MFAFAECRRPILVYRWCRRLRFVTKRSCTRAVYLLISLYCNVLVNVSSPVGFIQQHPRDQNRKYKRTPKNFRCPSKRKATQELTNHLDDYYQTSSPNFYPTSLHLLASSGEWTSGSIEWAGLPSNHQHQHHGQGNLQLGQLNITNLN